MATFRDGQEAQSGTIRRDPARLCGRRDGPGTSQEAWSASKDGAPGNCERDPARAQETRTKATEDRSIEGCRSSGCWNPIGRHRVSSGTQRIASGRGCARSIQSSPIAEVTVRQYVRKRKQELGGRAAFVPQSYDWGQEAQVDWFEAVAKLEGEPRKLQFFAMRSMASGDAFHRAYLHATQQALLEAHELAFAYFGGVFRTLRYDNMGSLVKKILRGRQRVETDRIIAFRSHWGFQSEYCNPAKGNEKGGVEGELGWYRRNCLTPVPEAESLAALNEQLLSACAANRQPHDPRERDDSWGGQRTRAVVSVAAGRGEVSL